jgi:isopenicillin N synthase-like dioxygenase
MSFDTIPILDLSLARSPDTKPSFLNDLRHALLEVGFLYIKNTGIPADLIEDVIQQGKAFFDLPLEKKLEVEMKNAKSFLGYSKLGMEITRFKTDWREQIDLSTEHPVPGLDQPLYHNLLAPNQWPDPATLPKFRPTYERYIRETGDMSIEFTSLIAEAVGLSSNAFDRFFDEAQQHKLKIVKYPDLEELGVEGEAQGVGPHKDSMLTSYLLQASHHKGLQVQASDGNWIDCPPIDGTLVVAIGQGMQALTQGVCQSTTHRVLSPARGSGPRFSIPFFQGVSYDATFESMDVPESVRELRSRILEQRGERIDDIEFTFMKGRYHHLGEATLMNRIKSHPDVGEKFVRTPSPAAQIISFTRDSIPTSFGKSESSKLKRQCKPRTHGRRRSKKRNYQMRKGRAIQDPQQSRHIELQ